MSIAIILTSAQFVVLHERIVFTKRVNCFFPSANHLHRYSKAIRFVKKFLPNEWAQLVSIEERGGARS